ncbi:hypothetical protein F1559_004985 [Cyanidiococcus yangmingshanensis]|uniref:Uncharacterized protein n=1 Tax=Cyanidiococcus yangmingshanensis TaxID=2690220 RepID=A0A7J7IQP6_9RHOD|nr:hypothetical protein F1559_004985 [Cyanidiococcus yangmingshanensis]
MTEQASTTSLDADTRRLIVQRHAALVVELNQVLAEMQQVRTACESRTWPRTRGTRMAELRARYAQLQTRSEELTALIHHLSAVMAGHDMGLAPETTPLRDTALNREASTLSDADTPVSELIEEKRLAVLTLPELRQLSIELSERVSEVERQIRRWHEQSDASRGETRVGESSIRLRRLEGQREQLNKCLDDIADAMLHAEEQDLWQSSSYVGEPIGRSDQDAGAATLSNDKQYDRQQRCSRNRAPTDPWPETVDQRSAHLPEPSCASPSVDRIDSGTHLSEDSLTETLGDSKIAADIERASDHEDEQRSNHASNRVRTRRTRSVSPPPNQTIPSVWPESGGCTSGGPRLSATSERALLLGQIPAGASTNALGERSSRPMPKYSPAFVQQRVEQARQRLARRSEALQHLHQQSAAMQDEATAFEELTDRLARKNRLFGGRFWESLF